MAFDVSSLLASSVQEIRLESAWTPPFVIAQPFAQTPPSPVASALGSFFKPVVVTTLAGGGTMRSAPYGEPGESNWPVVQITLAGGMILLAGWLFYRQTRKGRK
jgi:hypothetical protein